MTTNNIKIIRLQSGEDLVCLLEQDENTSLLIDPLQIIFKRTDVGTVLILMPWLPLELIESNTSLINSSNILTVCDPKQAFIEYYNKTVERLNIKNLLEKDKAIESLKSAFSDDDEDEFDDEFSDSENQISLEEIRKTLDDLKKGKLH